jgi:ribosome-binding protein aMBF1 (putative translation factor)
MSRDQLAVASGVSRETIRKVEEQGYVPTSATVRKLERALEAAERSGDLSARMERVEALLAEILQLMQKR